ncbi:hypothetical protein C8F04DRAFT_1213005 [Mycena alexandri]|uniref:Uncharacterized protein n=1 Tax=Mycena alexandri TaxID=1745969 RepID=A0AAD6WVI2_9AGAR|nr:hypothetical protein C8F04DRAFT_1213005 [Mycena alexandri]
MEKDSYQDALDRTTKEVNEKVPQEKEIWRATQHKDFSRNICFFMWMIIHGGYKVGNPWKDIEGHDHKAGVTESMDHILTRCDATGQSLVWDLASELWQLKTGKDLRPTLSEISVCGAMLKGDKGTSRLFRIVVSESAYLIWKLRNERLDCVLTNKLRYGKKALEKKLVEQTWKKVLQNEDRLPKELTRETGVLVGIG